MIPEITIGSFWRLTSLLLMAMPMFGHAKSAVPQVSQVQKEGELQIIHEDSSDKTKKDLYHYYLKSSTNERYELKIKNLPPKLLTGAKLRVKGTQTGSNVLALDSSSGGSIQVLAAPAPNTIGVQQVAVLLVNFASNPIQPFTATAASNMVFGTINSFYQENSFQQTSLTGNVLGWLTLSISPTCTTTDISTAAKQAATAAGINLAAYSRYVYIFPQNGNCPWSGMATVGGSPSEAWINGGLNLQVIGHELGHNFGLFHSHGLYCGSPTLGSACAVEEYGDVSDIMGNSTPSHFNAYQKEHLGWLNNGTMPPITTVSTAGTFTIDPYETSGTNPKALKILKSVDPTTGTKTWYYLEYRQLIGFDAILSSRVTTFTPNYLTQGVQVRIGTDNYPDGSSLLDMNLVTSIDVYNDAALVPGQSFTDTAAGVTFKTVSADSTGAVVSVSFSGSTPPATTCTHANPTTTLSTSQNTSVAAGTLVSYTLSVKNNDGSGCTASTFNLNGAVPAGWIGNLASTSLSINPGSSASTTFSVSSPVTAATGTYTLAATATNGSATTYSGSATATYSVTVSPSSALAITVSSNAMTYSRGSTAILTAQVTSGGAALSGASVIFTITSPNGKVTTQTASTGSTGSAVTSYTIQKKALRGVYQIKATVTSGGQTVSTTSNLTVQ